MQTEAVSHADLTDTEIPRHIDCSVAVIDVIGLQFALVGCRTEGFEAGESSTHGGCKGSAIPGAYQQVGKVRERRDAETKRDFRVYRRKQFATHSRARKAEQGLGWRIVV